MPTGVPFYSANHVVMIIDVNGVKLDQVASFEGVDCVSLSSKTKTKKRKKERNASKTPEDQVRSDDLSTKATGRNPVKLGKRAAGWCGRRGREEMYCLNGSAFRRMRFRFYVQPEASDSVVRRRRRILARRRRRRRVPLLWIRWKTVKLMGKTR